MSPVLATLDIETARKVADDIRDYGHGYVRFDGEGRAHYVPPYAVLTAECDERHETRMHE